MRQTVLIGILAVLLSSAGLVGCSGDDSPPTVVGNNETITEPVKPGGPEIVSVGTQYSFTTCCSETSAPDPADHPIEYRFDFDADGAHDYSSWGSSIALKAWSATGLRLVKSQGRCQIHTSKVSEWSLGKLVEVGLGPDTEITGVINTYYIGNSERQQPLDLTDGVPDTVPYGSWIKVLYRGIPSQLGDSLCADKINKCLAYQTNYTWVSVRNPVAGNTIAWRPFEPEDSNPTGVEDSTSMNIGSVEYTVRARAMDQVFQVDRADQTPPEIEIVGNFPPTLDDQSIENQDGTIVADADTVFWDWWNPANTPDTIDVITNPSDPQVVKEFYFVIKATGHDHPMDPQDSGVKSWKYTFLRAGSNPAVFEVFNSRAGDFVDGFTVNELADTAQVTFRYSLAGDPGGASILANLPAYLNKEYVYSVTGRDLSILDTFDQKMYYLGEPMTLNSYNTAEYGRWTEEGLKSFYLKLIN
jgi:hypothetical protein